MEVTNETFIIEATNRTPEILFNQGSGELKISGKSLPEYSYGFFRKILDEVDDYIENARQTSTLIFKLDYLNSVSSKMIMQIILKFERLLNIGKEVKILWYYHEDDDMIFEIGEVLIATTNVPVQLIKVVD